MIVPPRNRSGFITVTGGDQQRVVGTLGEGDFDPVLLDVDLGRGVEEVAEDLAGFGCFVAGQAASQAAIKARGDLGSLLLWPRFRAC